jgi:hypothetical protein
MHPAEARWELFDSLTPYEVAVFAFTSPREVDSEPDSLVLFGKGAYLWAGAVAHVLVRRPELTQDDVLGFFRDALAKLERETAPMLLRGLGNELFAESGLVFVSQFLQNAGLAGDDLAEVRSRTQDAIRSLEWRGLIAHQENAPRRHARCPCEFHQHRPERWRDSSTHLGVQTATQRWSC